MLRSTFFLGGSLDVMTQELVMLDHPSWASDTTASLVLIQASAGP